jgi:hypothetical protein
MTGCRRIRVGSESYRLARYLPEATGGRVVSKPIKAGMTRQPVVAVNVEVDGQLNLVPSSC